MCDKPATGGLPPLSEIFNRSALSLCPQCCYEMKDCTNCDCRDRNQPLEVCHTSNVKCPCDQCVDFIPTICSCNKVNFWYERRMEEDLTDWLDKNRVTVIDRDTVCVISALYYDRPNKLIVYSRAHTELNYMSWVNPRHLDKIVMQIDE